MKLKIFVAALISMFVMLAAMPSVAASVNSGTTESELQQQDPKGRKVKGKKKKGAKRKENGQKQKGERSSEQGQANRKTKGK